jgi:hypothetical protein
MNSAELNKVFNRHHIRSYDFQMFGLISIFDDEHYSNSDYDIVDPAARAKVRDTLLSESWKPSGSKVFSKEDVKVVFPEPSHTLGGNPADRVLEAIKDNHLLIVTPTQALLVSACQNSWNLKVAEKLVFYQPANLSKIWNMVQNDVNLNIVREDIVHLKEVQKKGFELRKKGEQALYPFK